MTIRVEEKSLELALLKAAGQLEITQEDLKYNIITESNGFLGLFGKKVAVEAWKKGDRQPTQNQRSNGKSDRKRESRPAQTTPSEKRVLSTTEIDDLIEDLRSFCEGLCSKMAHEPVTVEYKLENDRLILDIRSEYIAGFITKNTKLAEALEHILRKKPRYLRQELPFRIFVDCNSVRVGREKELVDMAMDLSAKVSENKRPIVLDYRSSYDRKIIHMALDKDDRVFTKSIGSGANRKLMILPSKGEEAANSKA